MKENSFFEKLPVFLGAKVCRAGAGRCLDVGARSYLGVPSYILLGQHQACNPWLTIPHLRPGPAHPLGRREAPFSLCVSPSFSLFFIQVWKP